MQTLDLAEARYGIPEHDLCTLGRSHKLRQPRYNLILNCAEVKSLTYFAPIPDTTELAQPPDGLPAADLRC